MLGNIPVRLGFFWWLHKLNCDALISCKQKKEERMERATEDNFKKQKMQYLQIKNIIVYNDPI